MKATAVYGPPGTGKTTWMMNKVTELVERGFHADQIMYLSFTKAATGEVLRRMGIRTSDTVSTIHSACYRLLKLGGSSVVEYRKLTKFGKEIGMQFKGNSDDAHETMEMGDMLLSLYQLSRSRLTSIEEEYERSDRPSTFQEFKWFVEAYDSWKESNGLIDFTDMLERYDGRDHGCKVVFVDESQDLSPLQWAVVKSFIEQSQVELVFFAGDDDQAIYEWAGANPHGMAKFEKEYGADRVVLDKSYRVPAEVHKVVTMIAGRIENRVHKAYAPRDEQGSVTYPYLFEPSSQKEGFILCRTHSIKQKVENQLIERRVPFLSDGGGLPGPFSCKAAKAIRAWYQYSETGIMTPKLLDAMVASATDRVRADLLAGDHKSVLGKDAAKIFKMPWAFADYFRDVDIRTNPKLIVCTIHASKGREHNDVTLVCDWTGRVQAGAVLSADAEHRVWYVGASRAKQNLRITTIGGEHYVV